MDGLLRFLVDFLYPPRCGGCGVELAEDAGLCAACWGGLNFIAAPCCRCCGMPFDIGDVTGEFLCAACTAAPPVFACARSALHYDDGSRRLILALKHGDRADLAPLLSRLMVMAGADVLDRADALVPVPLHPFRLWRRRYNQSQLLCLGLSKLTGIPVRPHDLHRVRATGIQGGLTRRERALNVRAAFRATGDFTGLDLVLVDDVLTTGATVESCARALYKAGAGSVRILTAARVVQPRNLPV